MPAASAAAGFLSRIFLQEKRYDKNENALHEDGWNFRIRRRTGRPSRDIALLQMLLRVAPLFVDVPK